MDMQRNPDPEGFEELEQFAAFEADTRPREEAEAADEVTGGGNRGKKPKKRETPRQAAISWAKTLLFALVLALIINNFIVVNAAVMSGSMEVTIMTGDRIMCNRLAYVVGEPRRFDIVVFNFHEGGETAKYVKRIIGLPGETVEIVDGKVYINGADTPLQDDFVNGVPVGDYGPFEVPEGHYFMLGDNRNNSYDSKGWLDPYISKRQILGKAMFCYYPSFYFVRAVEDA